MLTVRACELYAFRRKACKALRVRGGLGLGCIKLRLLRRAFCVHHVGKSHASYVFSQARCEKLCVHVMHVREVLFVAQG